MASPQAIAVFESVYRRTDQQVRDILAAQGPGDAEVDSVEVLIGDNLNVLTPGVAAAIRVDFQARITGAFLQEFDGISGSLAIGIEKAPGGPAPAFASIVGAVSPNIVGGRYGADEVLDGWQTSIDRGDVLRFLVLTVSNIRRVLVTLRIRRLEP